jgi:hypothetical protein
LSLLVDAEARKPVRRSLGCVMLTGLTILTVLTWLTRLTRLARLTIIVRKIRDALDARGDIEDLELLPDGRCAVTPKLRRVLRQWRGAASLTNNLPTR